MAFHRPPGQVEFRKEKEMREVDGRGETRMGAKERLGAVPYLRSLAKAGPESLGRSPARSSLPPWVCAWQTAAIP